MDSAVEIPVDLVSSLTDLYNIRLTALAWGIIIIFDHLITLGEEIELVWNERFTFVSALFFCNRYYGLFAITFNLYMIHATGHSQTTDESDLACYRSCNNWIQWQAWTGIVAGSAITQVILVLRVRALYLNNRAVTLIMVAGYMLAMVAAIVINVKMIALLTVRVVSVQERRVCAVGGSTALMSMYYVPIAVFETLLAVLAIARWIRERRSTYPAVGIMQALVRDSVVYFIVMTLGYATSVVLWTVHPSSPELPVGLVMSLSCVMASRLLLNVRARRRDTLSGSSFGRPSRVSVLMDTSAGRYAPPGGKRKDNTRSRGQQRPY